MNSILSAVRSPVNRLDSTCLLCALALMGLAGYGRVLAQPSSLKVIAWGEGGSAPYVPAGLTNVASIQAGEVQNMFIRQDHTVGGWGRCWSCVREIPPDLNDATAVSIGGLNVLALRSNGTVVGWGDDYFGETLVPGGLAGVIAIDTGNRQGLALKNDGTVVTWGQHGTNVPGSVQNVTAISAGKAENYFHALALKNDGTVVAWGRNDYGEGNVPPELGNVVAVSAGSFHNLALKADGTVVAWGGKDAQIITPPAGLSNVVAISAAELHNLALKSDGTVVSWNAQSLPEWWRDVPEGLVNVTAISAARFHSVALIGEQPPVIAQQPQSFTAPWHANSGNEVKAIGSDPLFYQWRKDGVDIPFATNAFLSLLHLDFDDAGDYTVVISNYLGSVTSDAGTLIVEPWIDILQHPISQTVDAGTNVTFSVIAVGSPRTYQWRRNGYDIPGAVEESLSFTNVQTEGGTYSVLIRSHGLEVSSTNAILTINGNVLPAIISPPRPEKMFVGAKLVMRVVATGEQPLQYQWQKDGEDLPGETGTSLTFVSIQSGDTGTYTVRVSNGHGSTSSPPVPLTVVTRTLQFPTPGIVVSIGGPMVPPGLTNVVAIAAGERHGLALKSDGTVAAWGGEITIPYVNLHEPPAGLSNVVAIAAGPRHNLALKADGTVVGWRGPTVPADLYGVIAIAAGESHGLAVKADGTVVSWGSTTTLPVNGLNNVISIAAGGRRNIALREDGTVLAWGLNVYQQVFGRLNQVAAVAAGRNHIIVLQSTGGIFDYFDGSDPTNSAPPGLTNVVAVAAGDSHSVGLKIDGSVVGWNGANLPTDLTNVTAIAAGRGFSLLLTTNPPVPELAGEKVEDQFLLSAPISVSGYVLEVTDDLSRPYQPASTLNTPVTAVDTNKAALALPISGQRFYRLKKL